jgi:hypothetical protein
MSDSSTSVVPGGITVVMPLFNKAAHVARALDSVLAQKGGFEALIVVDDGSQDDGPDIVRSYTDPRIRLMLRAPPGPGGYAARNLAIQEATTDWIAFLDADDAWTDEFITSIGSMVECYGSEIGCAFTSFNMRNPNGSIVRQRYGVECGFTQPRLLRADEFLDIWIAYADCPLWTGASAFRRRVLLDAGLFPAGRCKRGGDKDLWLRAMVITNAAFDPHARATYYRDSDNMVTSSVKTESRHCIQDTISVMIPICSRAISTRLKALSDVESFNYSISSFRSGTFSWDVWPTSYGVMGKWKYYTVALLSKLPRAAQPLAAKIIQRIDSMYRRAGFQRRVRLRPEWSAKSEARDDNDAEG